jgi:hypothetical protein
MRDLVTYAKRGDEVTRFEAQVMRAESYPTAVKLAVMRTAID